MSNITCRTCLKKTDPSQSKKITVNEKYNRKRIMRMLSFCVPELILDLVLEPSICVKCLKNLNRLDDFKRMCLRNDLNYQQGNQNQSDTHNSSEVVPYNSSSIDFNDSGIKTNMSTISDKNSDMLHIAVGSDINQNETPSRTKKNNHKKNRKIKKMPTYKTRFANTGCFGCHNKIRDVKYHSIDYKDGPYLCLNCDKTFDTIMQMRRHSYSHKFLHKCEICEKKTRDAYQLSLHLLSHTKQKPFECPECGKRFVQSYCLEQHLAIHKGVKDNKNRCDNCGKIFSTKYNLKIHMATHNGGRPRCPNCNKLFYTEAALIKHSSECITIKQENEIYIREIEIIKTEVPEYVKEEDQSDDDIFIEGVPSVFKTDPQEFAENIKEESLP